MRLTIIIDVFSLHNLKHAIQYGMFLHGPYIHAIDVRLFSEPRVHTMNVRFFKTLHSSNKLTFFGIINLRISS